MRYRSIHGSREYIEIQEHTGLGNILNYRHKYTGLGDTLRYKYTGLGDTLRYKYTGLGNRLRYKHTCLGDTLRYRSIQV